MKRRLFFVSVCFLMLQFSHAMAAFEDMDNKEIESLSSFDGVKNAIITPLNTVVPKNYFRAEFSSARRSDNYHTSFKVHEDDLENSILFLKSDLENESKAPVVISIRYHGNNYRNYIVQFSEKAEHYIELDLDIEELKGEMEHDMGAVRRSLVFKITMLSGAPFQSEISIDGETTIPTILIPENDNDRRGARYMNGRRRGDDACCMSTSGLLKQGIMSDTVSGAAGTVWVKIVNVKENANYSLGWWSYDCYSYMTVYWPTRSDVLLTPYSATYTRFSRTCRGGDMYFETNHGALQFRSIRVQVNDYIHNNGPFTLENTNGSSGPFEVWPN